MSTKHINCGQVTVQAQGRVSLLKFLSKRGIKAGDEIDVFFSIPLKKQYEIIKELSGDLFVELHSEKLGDEPTSVLVSKDRCNWVDVTDMTVRDIKNVIKKLECE